MPQVIYEKNCTPTATIKLAPKINMAHAKPSPLHNKRFQLLFFAFACVVLIPQLDELSGFSNYALSIQPLPALGAIAFSALTFVFAAMTYMILSPKRLRFTSTLIVQIACSFANRLLPAGIGGMGVNEQYLERSGHFKSSRAVSIVSANQLIGFLGYIVIVVLLLVSFDVSKHITSVTVRPLYIAAILCIGAMLVITGFLLPRVAKRIFKFLGEALQMLYILAKRPQQLFLAFFSSVAITLCFAATFHLVCLAAGIHEAFGLIMLVYLVGAAAATATPTPGGLVGVEAAMVASLISLGVPGGQALTAVIGFRLISFWLPILPGYLALNYAVRRQLI
jgi:uncharacterized protein (TIRG00374 family)